MMPSSLFLWLAFAAILLAAPASAQQCNHCGVTDECFPFWHWQNCGYGGPGIEFEGGCEGGCQPLDCSYYLFFGEGCDQETPEPDPEDLEDFLQELRLTDREADLRSVAKRAGLSRMVFDRTRNAVLLYSCSGSDLVGQILLGPEAAARIMATVEEEAKARVGDPSSLQAG